VRDGTIDLALVQRVHPAEAPGLKYRPLIRTRLVVVGRNGHPLGQAQSLSELGNAQWLVYRPPGSHGVLEDAMRVEGLSFPSHYVQCESYALTLSLLRASDLLGLLVPQVFADEQGAGLKEIPLKRPLPEISVGMYRRADTPASTAVTDFWTHLLHAARAHSGRR
jgi:DNA-binding transcriptional LysR family regulator